MTMTPSLSELLRELRDMCDWADEYMLHDKAPTYDMPGHARGLLSRLMAEGGLRAGASPLEVTDVMAGAAHTYHYRPASHLETPMDHWKGVVRAALLQAERSEGGSSNPIDDGAVERDRQTVTMVGNIRSTTARYTGWAQTLIVWDKAALEAAEPHP